MDTQQLEFQEVEQPDDARRTLLSLFVGVKWAIVVFCISVLTSMVVTPWFLLLGFFMTGALLFSDERILAYVTRRIARVLDSQYDEIEEMFSDIKPHLGSQYVQLLSQAMNIYREIKMAIRDRDGVLAAESLRDVSPAIQALMDKILHLTRKAQLIDNGLRCHDDVEHTRMVLDHYQNKIERDIADDFIKAEWIRTRDSLIKQMKSQEEIQRGKEYVQSKLTNIITSLREVHLSIIRLSFSDIQEGSDDLSQVYQTVINLSEAIDDTVETLDRITYHQG
jgi:uncharacterized protein YoxC